MKHLKVIGFAILTILSGTSSHADEVAVRKAIAERLPAFPKIDEISRTPVRGIYELRVGTDVLYVDENGDHLIRGEHASQSWRRSMWHRCH
jgi:thiol:disulfide interchange protein DsbC